MKKINLQKTFLNADWILIFVTLALVIFGIIMVYSASYYTAEIYYNNKFYFFTKQIIGAVLGVCAMVVFSKIDYHLYQKYKNIIMILCLVLLALVFVPYIGVSNNGSSRWINLFFFTIQPSELAKFGFVVFVAAYLSKNFDIVKTFKGILPVLCFGGLICLLIILEPNMSITMCVGFTMLIMLFVGGARAKHFALLAVPIILLVAVLILIEPYRLNRLVAFINPWANPQNEGYQLIQSLYSLGAGGWFGVGLFNSRQKFLFLPFSESDFIFSIVGEELGFLGCLALMICFGIIIYRGIKIAIHSVDRFGCYLASGIIAIIGTQVLINIAAVTGSIPPTGVPLPFISAGGTSLVAFMSALGVLLNIRKQTLNLKI